MNFRVCVCIFYVTWSVPVCLTFGMANYVNQAVFSCLWAVHSSILALKLMCCFGNWGCNENYMCFCCWNYRNAHTHTQPHNIHCVGWLLVLSLMKFPFVIHYGEFHAIYVLHIQIQIQIPETNKKEIKRQQCQYCV